MPRNSCSRIEYYIYQLVNSSRRRRHLPKIRLDKGLSQNARRHSQHMAHSKNIFHDPDAGFENVAYVYHPGSSDWKLANIFHRQWMKSRGHRENILHSNNNTIGIGVVRRGNHFYATQKFTRGYGPYDKIYEKNAEKAIIYLIIIIVVLWLIFTFL